MFAHIKKKLYLCNIEIKIITTLKPKSRKGTKIMTVQDILDMMAAMIPVRDIEEILIQGYGYTRADALALIQEAKA